jgi:hypothetical protein
MTAIFIFNQYYIDFLKRLKNVAKENRESSNTAKNVFKTIKEHYMTFDKTSDEYLQHLNEHVSHDAWDAYVDNYESWLQDNSGIQLYKEIVLGDIIKLMQDNYLCHHFISVFFIFRNELSDEISANIVKILQTMDGKDLIEQLEDEKIKKVLTNLHELRNKNIKEKAGIDMNFIEDTTLGKLAKEILQDVDVGKLQKSMGENGDVLKAIGDPDSGFADIITNVSKKMANKISNGELKQENLIQDAMKFASIMPNLFGGPGGPRGAGGPGGAGGKQPDMSNIMSMMSTLMGNAKGMPRGHGSKMGVNENALKKIAKAKKLKKKLHEKKKASNTQTESSNKDT